MRDGESKRDTEHNQRPFSAGLLPGHVRELTQSEADFLNDAFSFASSAHRRMDQVRKHTGEPYEVHPLEVCHILMRNVPGVSVHQLAAALLHDTVEDTDVTLDQICEVFGPLICEYVDGLTDVSKPEDGNRQIRKEIDRLHTAKAIRDVKTVKLADVIDNSISIIKHDPDFSRVYIPEKKRLLEVLTDGDQILFRIASGIVDEYMSALK